MRGCTHGFPRPTAVEGPHRHGAPWWNGGLTFLQAVFLLLLIACGDPASPSERIVGDLRLRLTLSGGAAQVGDTLKARVVINNLGPDIVRLSGGSACLAQVGVYQGDERKQGFEGTDYLCLAVVTTWVVSPADSLASEWRIGVGTGTGGRRPQSGDYTVRVAFRVVPSLPPLEAPFVLR